MTRIAVCWSGQSRIHRLNDVDNNQYDHWNKIWDLHQWVLQDFDVTHYGHTWDDQLLPPNQQDFKKIRRTDQNEILEWILEEPGSRAQFIFSNNMGNMSNTKKWTSASVKEKWNVLLEIQKPTWGQYWSFAEAANDVVQDGGYDFILKTRWDAYFMDPKQQREQTRQELIKTVEYINNPQESPFDFDKRTVYTANAIKTKFRSSWIPDFWFLIPCDKNSFSTMHGVFDGGPRRFLGKGVANIYNNYIGPWDVSGHGLWSDLFTNLGFSVRPGWTHPLQKIKTYREWHKYWEDDYPDEEET